MSKAGSMNIAPGVYRSDCCGIERVVEENQRFPSCDGGGMRCAGSNANWIFVRKTPTK
jgi:hypothetical protein